MVQEIEAKLHPLVPGKEYYFNEAPVNGYFFSNKFKTKPLSADAAEQSDYIRIAFVDKHQRIDRETTYLRKREPFPLYSSKFQAIPDGLHFYLLSSNFLLDPLTLTQAIHSEQYLKVLKTNDHAVQAELVSTPAMNNHKYTYYTDGHPKTLTGMNRTGTEVTTYVTAFDENGEILSDKEDPPSKPIR